MDFLKAIEHKIIRFLWNHRRPQIVKAIRRQKNKARDITLPNFKLHYKATISKTSWYRQTTKHTQQWNRIESPEINTHVYVQIIFDKGAKNIQWRK